MRIAKATVHAGICGFVTRVRAEGEDDYTVRLQVESDCAKVSAFAQDLLAAGDLSALDELSQGHEGSILSAARRHLKGCCSACVAPDGVFKAMQVATRLALPKDVQIQLKVES